MKTKNKIFLLLVAFAILFVLMTAVAYYRIPFGIDWTDAFRPAVWDLLSGRDPYNGEFFNPPWTLILLAPFALLPETVGAAAMFSAGVFAYGYLLLRLGYRPLATALFVFSPLTLMCYINGNIDWLALLGLVMPPWIGLFFLAIKPQITAGAIVFILYQAYRSGGLRGLVKTAGPVAVAGLASAVIWPGMIARAPALQDATWNASVFPGLLPLGVGLLVWVVRKGKLRHAAGSSVFVAPYLAPHSWAIALLALDDYWMAVGIACIWGLQAAGYL
jgi:hypothetical protein